MKIKQFTRSALALLLILASLVGMVPAVFANEAAEPEEETSFESEKVEVSLNGLTDEEELTSLHDLIYPQGYTEEEDKAEVKATNYSDYVFMSFRVGDKSRNFNWQSNSSAMSGSQDVNTMYQLRYFSAYERGVLSTYLKGTNPCIYMPIETHANGLKRLNSYKLKSGDVVQVRLNGVRNDATLFPSNGASTGTARFDLRTSADNDTFIATGSTTITKKSNAQFLNFTVKADHAGKTLYGVRFYPLRDTAITGDKIERTINGTKTEGNYGALVDIDYIYIGPANMKPVSVQYYDENGTKLYGEYFGYGEAPVNYRHGKTNSEDTNYQTIWGWQVKQYINSEWTPVRFVVDPTTYRPTTNVQLHLTQVKIPKATLNSTQKYNNGVSINDDKYVMEVDCFDTAQIKNGSFGTPVDLALVLDRSGSEGDLVNNLVEVADGLTEEKFLAAVDKVLDKTKWEGYYRGYAWTRYYNRDTGESGGSASGHLHTMPIRYYKGAWQMQVCQTCSCNGDKNSSSNRDYGIYVWQTGLKQCPHTKWVSLYTGYTDFVTKRTNEGSSYTTKFRIGISRLGRMQEAVEYTLIDMYNSTQYLKKDQYHKVSVICYGHSVFEAKFPYNNLNGNTAATSNTVDLTTEAKQFDYSNYESILKLLRQTYIFGQTRTDRAMEMLSYRTTDNGYQEADHLLFLPERTTTRKNVVIVATDGCPTAAGGGKTFDATAANRALLSSYYVKGTGTPDYTKSNPKVNKGALVYVIGIQTGLNAGTGWTSSYNTSTDEVKKNNNFLNYLSSNYKAGSSLTKADVTKSKTKYYFSSASDGDDVASAISTIWKSQAPTVNASALSGPGSLWLHEYFSREWKPDSAAGAMVNIYAEPHTGGGKYGTRVLIGQHAPEFDANGQLVDKKYTGNGYVLHLKPYSDTQCFSAILQWKDSKSAFIRETEVYFGSQAKALSGTLSTLKGYRIIMEIPLEVDRNNTVGGNNIPLTTSTSGCYQAKDSLDTEMGTKLYSYVQPNANVRCAIDGEAHDYFVSMAEYVNIANNADAVNLKTDIMDKMIVMPPEIVPANFKGLSNLDYVSFDVQLKAPNGTLMYHKAADFNATSLKFDVESFTNSMADLMQDQKFTMTVMMNHLNSATDSFGRAPYPNVNTTLYPTYYVPKFAVADFGDNISVPMGLEGSDASKLTGISGGTFDSTAKSMVYTFDKKLFDATNKTIPYKFTCQNTPMGATSNVISREVTVIPGNVVTYDDDVLTYAGAAQLTSKTEKWTSKITGKEKTRTLEENRVAWTSLGTKTNIVQTFDNTTSHGGYDAKYATTGYFHGSTMMATVGETSTYDSDGELIKKVSNSTAQTQFTFKGTGFEIISRTTRDSGVLLAEVFSGTSIGANATPVKSILCNTYLSTADYNQAPVIRWTGGYGDYTVRLTAYYNVAFAFRSAKNPVTEEEAKAILGYDDSVDFTYIESKDLGNGERGLVYSYNVYVDGIRVFNPMNQGNTVSQFVYGLANEGFANFGDIQNIVLDATNWKGGQATGMLYLADRNSNIGNNTQDEQLSSEHGFPLFMNGELSYDKVGGKTYFKDKDGNRIKDPATGYDIYSTLVDGSYKYRIDKATKTHPYTELSRDYVRSVLIGYSGYFYNKIYRSYGAKNEVQLQNGQGVAFAADAGALHLSLKSANGTAVKVQVWNGTAFEDYKDPKNATPLTALTSTTEMFFDFSKYKGTVIIKNAGSGILSICQVKYVDDSPASKGIYIDEKVAMAAMAAFDEAEPVTVLDSLKLSHSLNLQSNIGINYIIPKAAVADFDHYALTCTVGNETYTLTGTENGELIYFTLDCLTAAQMNDNVSAVLNATKGEETFVSPVDDYSIAAYAYTMMNKEGVSEAIKSLCANLLRYGAATQTFLGKTESGLADEELTAEQREWLRDLETVEFGNHFAVLEDVAEPAVIWSGKTLALDSTVAVKFVVDATGYAGDPAELELRVTYTGINGETKELTLAPTVYNAENNLYMFTVDQLDAAELRTVLTCQVFGNGEAVSQTMTYSADSYAAGKTGTLLELCKALFAYVDQAKAVFAN